MLSYSLLETDRQWLAYHKKIFIIRDDLRFLNVHQQNLKLSVLFLICNMTPARQVSFPPKQSIIA